MSVSRGGVGLLVREGGSGVSRSSPTFLPLLSKPGGSGEGVQAGKTHWPSGLGPQPGGPLQDPTLPCKPQGSFPASLSTRSWGPNPRQRSPGLREGELEIVLTALPPLLPVCLSSSLCLWRSLGPAGCYASTATSGAASGWWAAVRSPTG